MVRRIAGTHGEKEAIVSVDERLTYAGLERASRHLAKSLIRSGVGKGTRVGFLFPNGPEWVVSFFAIARIGAVAVPMSSFYKPGEMQKVLRLADIHTLLFASDMFGSPQEQMLELAIPGLRNAKFPELFIDSVPALRATWIWGSPTRDWATPYNPGLALDGVVSDELLEEIEAEVAPADVAVLIHTSGTSTDPKGVLHTHGAVVRHSHQFCLWGAPAPPQRYIGPEERTLVSQAFFWVAGLMQDLLAMLHAGGTLLVQDKFEPQKALELIQREKATKVSQAALGRFHARPDLVEVLRTVESLTLPTVTGPRQSGCGMTETLSNHCHAQGDFDDVLPSQLLGACGTPVPFMQHRIVDPNTGQDLEEGVPGMLLVRGYALMAGLNKMEREEVFDEDGWYWTGDRCMLREGFLFFIDRYGEMIKTSGANVSPPEVERVFFGMPEVSLVVVVGVPDETRGQIVAAAIVPAQGQTIDVDEILNRAKRELSSFKVPRKVVVYEDEEFPRLANGKPDKRVLIDVLKEAVSAE
jgi:acyl-CoA synthetase (AMP-forming)/AMP-acid ligase II